MVKAQEPDDAAFHSCDEQFSARKALQERLPRMKAEFGAVCVGD
jgi:hypothetical protein